MKETNTYITVLLLAILLNIGGCVRYLNPVATLDELDSKQNLEKRRDWFTNSHGKTAGAAGAGAAMVFIPVLIPFVGTLFKADEKELTIKEIADVSAVKTYDYDSTLLLEWIAHMDGVADPDYWIIGRGKGNKETNGVKPVGVVFWNKNENKVYYEGWVIKKTDDGNYLHWRLPLLRKDGDNLLYEVVY